MMKKSILELLIFNKDTFLSGEEISNKLAVSRTAIWKQINGLKEEGYVIESVPRKGYKLLSMPDIFMKEEILINLKTKEIGQNLYVYDEVETTNSIAKKLAAEGSANGTVVVAEKQTKGKGRLNRYWESPKGKGIWFSIVLKPAIKPFLAPQLTFVSAVAVCRALRKTTGLEVYIKWPNDIVCMGRKLCGISTELNAEIDIINYIVVGIGLNVKQDINDFPEELTEKAISLKMADEKEYRRAEVLEDILYEFESEYQQYLESGFAGVLQHWRELNTTIGKDVIVISLDERYKGTAIDVDEEGYLLVQNEEGLQRVIAGDVSIRRSDGSYV